MGRISQKALGDSPTARSNAYNEDGGRGTVDDMRRVIMKQKSGESSSCSTRLELPPLPRLVVGMDAPLKDLKEKLLCDDGVSMLVLTAPGGCGKTTLATMFCKDEEVKGKFKNNIVFVTVSQNGNLELVVKRLCEYVCSPVPKFQNEVHMFQRKFFNAPRCR
uniref:probable disease resistance protein At5g66900 n=1 Tax=Fragaria vesca subsp. vesca TaxID=101020 RepID=UPI0005C86712|nr:PREDICTED: probable disease resistance protein At5g66900 [Fragaria vesca subsp. vesca]